MKIYRLFLLAFCFYSTVTFAQKSLLQSGPMVGYCEMTEALIWVQTKKEAKVKIEYFAIDNPQNVFVSSSLDTKKEDGYTAKLILDKITEGKMYNYTLFINNNKINLDYETTFSSKELWQWRKEAPDFSVALGSCTYINEPDVDRQGKGYGDNYSIFRTINNKKPNIMLWLGDNTYLREADFDSKTGIYHRFTHSRSISDLQPLLARTQNIAIWDDHDFGPNDSDRSYTYKYVTQKAFKDFWGNKTYGLDFEQREGVFSTYSWGDVQFFLLDDRFFKSPNDRKTGEKTILGKQQLEWFIDALASSTANFKVVCIGGQVINSAEKFENYANYSNERDYLLSEIQKNKVRGVFFLTGDRHFSELSSLKRENTYPLYDWTVSPLTSGVAKSALDEKNTNRVEGSLFMEQNFGMLYFSGDRKNRQVKMVLYNPEGKELWDKVLLLNDLK